MAHLGKAQKVVRFRLSARDAASLKKIARAEERTMTDVVRLLIRRASAAQDALALAHAAEGK